MLARIIILTLGVQLSLLTSGCRRTDPGELRLGINPWPGYEFLYLAKEMGSNGADVILDRTNLASMASLKGPRVGLEIGSLDTFMLARYLERDGLRLGDVEMVSCIPDRMQAAMAGGEVDAVVTYPPASVRLEAGGLARRLFSSADIPGEVVDVVAVDASLVERYDSLQARLSRAFQRALDYARDHRQEAYAIMVQREGLSATEFAEALEGIKLLDTAGQKAFSGRESRLRQLMQGVERVLIETGQIGGGGQTARMRPPAAAATGKQN